MSQRIVACVPSVRSEKALNSLLGIANQSRPVAAILVHDESLEGLTTTWLLESFCTYAGIEVHRGPWDPESGYSRVAASRKHLGKLADLYEPDWLWFVDDDVFPTFTCLEELLRTADSTTAPMISASLVNLLPSKAGEGAIRTPPRNHGRREHDMLMPTTSGDCFMVRPHTWDVLDHDVTLKEGAEDLIVSAQVSTIHGGIMQSCSAVALHLRDYPASWHTTPATAEAVQPHLTRVLGDARMAARILTALGEQP